MKHFISSLSVLCANTPPCEGRISSRKILSLLLILFLSIGNVWAEPATYVMYPDGGSTFNSEWNKTSRTAKQTYASKVVVQMMGVNGGVYGEITSKNTVANINAISVKCTANNAQKLTLYYSTDNSQWTELSNTSILKNTSSYSDYDVDVTGIPTTAYIKFRAEKNSIYLYSITISTSEVATPDPVDPTASFNDASYTVGQTLDLSSLWTSNSTGEVTYTVANAGTTGASISGSLFTATAAGTCTVKASQAATSAYNAIDKTATITVTAPTPATVTLSEAGAVTNVADKNVGDSYTLPSTSTQTCGDKVFVGWSTVEIATPGDKPTSNFYEPGTTVTLVAEQKFYAVYATGSGTPETWEQTTSVAVGNQVIIAQVDNGTKEMTGLGKTPETANNNYGVGTDFTTNPNGTLVWTVEEGNAPGQFSFNNGSYYLNLGSDDNYLSYSITKNANSSWTVSTSGERAVVTNATYDSRKIMWNKSNTRFASYSKNHGNNSGQYYYHIVFYKKSGGMSYSDYTTSCAAAPEPAVLVSIAANAEGKNEFKEGDEFVKAIITATYDDATTKDVTEDATFTGYDMSTPGTQTVTVTYEDKTTTYTITVTARLAATLTLSKNSVEETFPGEHKVGDVITLPDFMSDCSKTFVGWDSKSDCTEAPEYAPGAEYTLAAENQTLYAVYANVVEGAPVNVFSETFDACEGSGGNDDKWSGSIASGTLSLTDWELVKGSPANGCAKFGTGSAKGSAETPAITLTGNATLTFRSGAWNGSSEKTTLNLSAIGATLSQTSVTLVKGAWTEYTIYITEATGSVKIKFEASVDDSNRFFLDDVVVSQASVTYSDYSTTCTAALDAPTFTPVAGTYNEVTNVTISATDDVYYTLDGTTPTKESNKYTGPIILNLNGTTTIKAIAISGESQSSVVSATYSIKLPLTTMDEIFAAATTAGGAEAPVLITMNNWVVSAIRDDNKTAYVTDGTKGFVIYKEDHGFNVGDILSGTVACNVQLFKGSAELTELTATTEGLTVTTGGVVSPVVVNDVTTLGGVNTGSLIKINGVHASDNIVNNVKLYNTLFSFENLTPGQEYNVTGVYLQFGDTKEILPRSAADIEEVAGIPTATISIENITLVEGDEHAIVAVVTPAEAEGKVTYSIKSGSEYISLLDNVITANAVGTATITAAIAEVDGVYHGTTKDFTVTVKEYVAPISGRWELVTDASTLKAGDKVIVAQYVEEDGTIYTMGGQKTNNRDVVESSVLGETLTPTTGTAVLTLVDAGDGKFAFQASNGKYLSAAGTGTSNHLREAENYDSDKTKWTISVTAEGIATIKATSDNRNWMRYNPNNGSPLFSCYGSAQQDIALYKKMPDYTRDVRQGYYGTICLPNGGMMFGASIFEIAYKDASKIYFDEIVSGKMEAGIPYIFLPNEGVTELEVYYTDELNAPAGSKNGLVGSYTQKPLEKDGNDYILLNNQYCEVIGEAYVGANRAYFQLSGMPTSAPAPAPGVRRVSMGMAGQNTATGVDQVQGDEVPTKMIINGQLFILRGEKMYDAQGKLVK